MYEKGNYILTNIRFAQNDFEREPVIARLIRIIPITLLA